MLSHNVFFTLNDNSEAAKQALVASCKTYLASPRHGFLRRRNASPTATAGQRPGFDVALHVVLRLARLARCLSGSPGAPGFIAENKPNWKQFASSTRTSSRPDAMPRG